MHFLSRNHKLGFQLKKNILLFQQTNDLVLPKKSNKLQKKNDI